MREILLTQGQVALVDDSDFEFLSQWKWCARYSNGHWDALRSSRTKDGKCYTIKMSRQILGLELGDKRQGDHQNHNTLDNRRDNLRICTNQENNMNRMSNQNSSSKFKGVSWYERCKKWQVHIQIDGGRKHIGYFNKEKNAALAYDAAAIREFGEFAHLNFPAFQRSLVC